VSLVAVEREPADHERVAEKVEELAGVADAVRASDPEGVFEVALIDSESFLRGYKRAKSGSNGGMDRTFSVRLNFRTASSAFPCNRTVMRWFSYRSGS
jgi:hypothetical protein